MDLFAVAFSAWGADTTWLEVAAFVLSLLMVWCNIREWHWGWPLAAISSLLYVALFWRSRLYGDGALQIFFAVIAVWGWTQWLRGAGQPSALTVQPLGGTGWRRVMVACLVLWPATGGFLSAFTDTDVPWWDAFPTALSIVGQVLLGRKYLENWLIWIAVNVVSVGLFAYKGLWLTALLYVLFVGLSVLGWRVWRRALPAPAHG